MSISPSKTLSIIQSMLNEGRQQPEPPVNNDGTAFSSKLDKALGNGLISADTSSQSLSNAAEFLRLQTLRSSMSLLDETTDRESASGSSFIQKMTAAYISNLPKGASDASKLAKPDVTGKQINTSNSSGPPMGPDKLSLLHTDANSTDLEAIIKNASKQYGVAPELIKAVIKAESNFNPNAVSHAGAKGLMQLMPATARGAGVTDPFNPEQNIMGGTKFLKRLLDRYNGNLDSALAAYNWGPGNLERKPDRLPRETRDYLAKVKQYLNQYMG